MENKKKFTEKTMPQKTECICPNCGHREPYNPAIPCYTRRCPKCETPLY